MSRISGTDDDAMRSQAVSAPLRPRPRLFIGLLAGFVVWVIALIVMRLTMM